MLAALHSLIANRNMDDPANEVNNDFWAICGLPFWVSFRVIFLLNVYYTVETLISFNSSFQEIFTEMV